MTGRPFIALLAALAVAGTAPALAASRHPDTLVLSAAKKKKRVHRVEPQGEIACGPWGCRRIPPNCHIQGTVLDWRGNPTGIDDVRCR